MEGVSLRQDNGFSKLGDIRFDLAPKLLEELNCYFPEWFIDIFSILNTEELAGDMDTDTFERAEEKELAEAFPLGKQYFARPRATAVHSH